MQQNHFFCRREEGGKPNFTGILPAHYHNRPIE
jgi:hypothetical protein